MSFILRAALVIGALSYFALQREGTGTPAADLKAVAQQRSEQVTALAGSLSSDMREAVTQAATAEISKRFSAQTTSRDTLLAADRRPEWRGSGPH